MPRTPHSSASVDTLTVAEIEILAEEWFADGEIRQWSENTLSARRLVLQKLVWYFQQRGISECNTSAVRSFLRYLTHGHSEEGGRWGTGQKRPPKPSTVVTYFGHLQTFFRFLVEQEELEASPMDRLKPPINRRDQIQPFTPDQVEAIIAAARRSQHPRRNELIVLMLLDTGCRATELCGLLRGDVDLKGRSIKVHGKGHKDRIIPYGAKVTRALFAYLRENNPLPEEPLFTSDAGTTCGEALTRWGVRQLIERLGDVAGVEAVRKSPHTFRHTFAIEFLRNGGDIYVLQQLLGHTSLDMCKRYLAIAKADLQTQHRRCSPADRLKRRQQ